MKQNKCGAHQGVATSSQQPQASVNAGCTERPPDAQACMGFAGRVLMKGPELTRTVCGMGLP